MITLLAILSAPILPPATGPVGHPSHFRAWGGHKERIKKGLGFT